MIGVTLRTKNRRFAGQPLPILYLGTPEPGRRGSLIFPALVIGIDGVTWLAIGHVHATARGDSRLLLSAVPSSALVAVRAAVAEALLIWHSADRDRRDRSELLDNRRAALAAAISRRSAIDQEIAEIEGQLRDLA